MMNKFHWRDGVFFERKNDSSVRVVKTYDGQEPREDDPYPDADCPKCGERMIFMGEARPYLMYRCRKAEHGVERVDIEDTRTKSNSAYGVIDFTIDYEGWNSIVAALALNAPEREAEEN